MKIIYHEIDGSTKEMTPEEYYKDKPINYEPNDNPAFVKSLVNVTDFDKIITYGSGDFFNPFFKPREYWTNKGFTINIVGGTGYAIFCLKK